MKIGKLEIKWGKLEEVEKERIIKTIRRKPLKKKFIKCPEYFTKDMTNTENTLSYILDTFEKTDLARININDKT